MKEITAYQGDDGLIYRTKYDAQRADIRHMIAKYVFDVHGHTVNSTVSTFVQNHHEELFEFLENIRKSNEDYFTKRDEATQAELRAFHKFHGDIPEHE